MRVNDRRLGVEIERAPDAGDHRHEDRQQGIRDLHDEMRLGGRVLH